MELGTLRDLAARVNVPVKELEDQAWELNIKPADFLVEGHVKVQLFDPRQFRFRVRAASETIVHAVRLNELQALLLTAEADSRPVRRVGGLWIIGE